MLDLVLLVAAALLAFLAGTFLPLALFSVYILVRIWLLRPQDVRRRLALYRAIRPRHAALALLILGGVVLSAWSLLEAPEWLLPYLWWSWLDVVAQEPGQGANIALLPLGEWWLAVPYIPLLLVLLPFLVELEERIFRAGTRSWPEAVWRSLVFGSVHILVGVPVGVAVICLGLAGMAFSAEYFRAARRVPQAALAFPSWPEPATLQEARRREAGVQAAAVLHLAYNLLVLSLLVVFLALPPDLLP